MFIYLSKKIAIPKGVGLRCVSWNSEQGWIACGGESGLLKVLKLESAVTKTKGAKGVAAPSNLSMNQTLEGHNGAVECVTWNAQYKKLTTSDEFGLIIVWMLHKGMWFEEMINNRNKSVVTDMKWTADGQKICIIYKDGAVIVGSVDGNRLWGKELGFDLAFVEWSPDGRNILFVTQKGEVVVYDSLGNKLATLNLFVTASHGDQKIIGIHWYDGTQGFVEPNAPTLTIAFEHGKVQVTRGQHDENPVLIDTGLKLSQCRWNPNGSVLALSGTQRCTLPSGQKRDMNMVQFYSPSGHHLATLKVPGSGINALSWEGGGLRISLAVSSYIYFANIRPDYKWGFFANTLVYAYQKLDRKEQCVLFWDVNADMRYTKSIKKLLGIRASGDNCVLATSTGEGDGQYALLLCNAIGSPIESKYINVEPLHMTMTPTHVVVASAETVYLWQYRVHRKNLAVLGGSTAVNALQPKNKEGREQIFHIEDTAFLNINDVAEYTIPEEDVSDPISCICCSDRFLMVGRESGDINRYTLPYIEFESKYHLKRRPRQISLNYDSTRMSVIDVNGILTFIEVEPVGETMVSSADNPVGGRVLDFERKDIWDLKWADDEPYSFAVMEKTRMYIFRDQEPEEPMLSSGYLCQFHDQKINAVLLDEVMPQPTRPRKEYIIDFETKALRDGRALLENEDLEGAYAFLAERSHPRLWRLMAEVSLDSLEFDWADKAFVRCGDYQGIQFVKRLRQLKDKMKQKAEVAVYFQRYDEAENIYRDIDRKDLAIELRKSLGDWFRVSQLVQSGGGDDDLLATAWNHIGDYYACRQKWDKAAQHYARAKNTDALINAYFKLENFDELANIMEGLHGGDSRLLLLGRQFQIFGMHEKAVKAFVKSGDIKAAIDCCVLLNRWGKAVELAEAHAFPQIQTLLAKYANHLLESGDVQGRITAVRLYKRANRSADAARLLSDMAKEQINKDPMRAKKLFVLAGLELERYRTRVLDVGEAAEATAAANGATLAEQTLANLMEHDQATGSSRALDKCWEGAESVHFFLLAQRLLYNGDCDNAMRCALKCAEYDILDPKDVYSILAVASYHAKFFGVCSKAFVKLETLPTISDKERTKFQELALAIFLKNAPVDMVNSKAEAVDGKSLKICAISGNKIGLGRHLICRVCHNVVIKREMAEFDHCPLCHCPDKQMVDAREMSTD